MALAPLLQIRAIRAAYGIASRNAALIVPDTVAALVSASTIAVALRFRRAG